MLDIIPQDAYSNHIDTAFVPSRAPGKVGEKETDMSNTQQASRKILCTWTDSFSVDIWENCTFTITLYADRAVYKGYATKWDNNTGTLSQFARRITGKTHAALLALDKSGEEDGEDYTDEAFAIINESDY